MSLPSAQRSSPRERARAAAASGRLHDVVIASSKVIHGMSLGETDRASLRWARGLLNTAIEQTSVLAMPAAGSLAAEGSFAVIVRQAVSPADGSADERLRSLSAGIDACLRGARDEPVSEAVVQLREVFVSVARLVLQADVQSESESQIPEPWTRLTPSSSS